jgi:outer membrane protein assembly factor BamD (BamD/ComL family)
MFLLAVPVQAEDKIDPASAPEASGAPAAATTGSQPTDNLPTLVIPEPPAPVVSNSDKLLIQRKLLAPKKIELLRATVKATTVEKGFFSSLFSSSVNPVDIELLAEMDRFINQSPELAESAEVYQLKAQVHKRIQNFPAVALDWAMLLAAYPDSSFTAEAQKGLKELSDGKLKKQAATIAAMTEKLGSLSGERDQREATFLIFLGTLRDADFAVPIAAECAAFLARNQTYTDDDRIVHAQAHQQMQINNDVAIYHFNKLLALYPASTLRPDSYLSLGTIQRKGLKHYDLAAVNFKAVIEKHSESEEAKQAYELLANMYDEDMSDYPNAIKIYEAIVTRYKNDPVVLRALQAQARIYQNKTS